jgi:putative tryptophan/tyrosine transport system substrate-binding protein
MRRRDMLGIAGAFAAWPVIARSNGPTRVPKIGVLWHAANPEEEAPYLTSLVEGFRSLGYGDGRISLEHRFPSEKPELFVSMAAELAAMKPDAIIAVGSAAPYAVRSTTSIPIVFMYVPDPLGSKLVQSIQRPGGNATGLSNFSVELSAKRLEVLKEVMPSLSRVALLINPNAGISDLYVEQARTAGPKLGIATQAFAVHSLSDLEAAFDAMTKADMQAVVINAESLFYVGKTSIASLAIARRLPTCVWVRECAEAGALLSYGTDQRAIARRTAAYVDRILKGEKTGDIPVEQPTQFELAVNLKTAKALELTVPFSLLTRADQVIE